MNRESQKRRRKKSVDMETIVWEKHFGRERMKIKRCRGRERESE